MYKTLSKNKEMVNDTFQQMYYIRQFYIWIVFLQFQYILFI